MTRPQKIALITPCSPDLGAFALRALAANLRRNGHEVRLVMLSGGIEKTRHEPGYTYTYSKALLDSVVDVCQGADVIGISFMSPYRHRVLQLTAALRAGTDALIAWGGMHPSAMPEDLIGGDADVACIGEGDGAMDELVAHVAEGKDWRGIRNLAWADGDKLVKNPNRPLEDLDTLPGHDWNPEGTWVQMPGGHRLLPLTPERMKALLPRRLHTEGTFTNHKSPTYITFKTLTSRGCPYTCTFCGNSFQDEMYEGKWGIRFRSTEQTIAELRYARQLYPFMESIHFCDDAFAARPTAHLEAFLEVYGREIGLPFSCQITPGSLNPRKLEALLDAGLYYLDMGIQAGSDRGREVYGRFSTRKQVLDTAALLNKYVDRMAYPAYHVLLDNPWESTQDVLETLELVLQLPVPFRLKRSSLVPYPGTPLYHRAVADGLLTDPDKQIYNKHLEQPFGSYPNLLMYLAGFPGLRRDWVRALARPDLVDVLDRDALDGVYAEVERTVERAIRVRKAMTAVRHADAMRFVHYGMSKFGLRE